MMDKKMTAHLREAKISDLGPIIQLIQDLGLEVGSNQEDFIKKWYLYSVDNPANNEKQFPFGWVLELNAKIVGYFGSIHRKYHFGSQNISVAVASTWAVQKDFRSQVPFLCQSFFEQSDIDLFLVTTAIKPTVKIFERFGGQPLPDDSYNNVFYWVFDSKSFVSSILKKIKCNPFISLVIQSVLFPLYPFINTFFSVFNGVYSKNLDNTASWNPEKDKGSFDELWVEKMSADHRFMAYRDQEHIDWYSNILSMKDNIKILIHRENDSLRGYLIFLKQESTEISLKRFKIIDFFAINDDIQVLDSLFRKAYLMAKRDKGHILELVGGPKTIKEYFLKYRPLKRNFPVFPFYFMTPNKDLKNKLEILENWYPTILDGDSSF
jgi:hypothetical protein